MPAAFRMPASKLAPHRMLALCDGMIETARPFEGVLVSNGMPPDFLAQFARTRDEVARLDAASEQGADEGAVVVGRIVPASLAPDVGRAMEDRDAA